MPVPARRSVSGDDPLRPGPERQEYFSRMTLPLTRVRTLESLPPCKPSLLSRSHKRPGVATMMCGLASRSFACFIISIPPTIVTVVRPRDFPTTRNCSVNWYASSLPISNDQFGWYDRDDSPGRSEDDSPNSKWIPRNPLDDRQRESHRFPAARLCSSNAVPSFR